MENRISVKMDPASGPNEEFDQFSGVGTGVLEKVSSKLTELVWISRGLLRDAIESRRNKI